MKFVNLAVLAFASCILAKNIIYLDDLVTAVKNDKREAKNIVNLDALKQDADSALYDDESEQASGKKAKKRDVQDVLQPSEPSGPLLQSLLPQMNKISVFSSYLRNDQKLVGQLESAESFVLIVAPTDDAFSTFSALTGKKPWEFPEEIKNDETDDQVIQSNLKYFVEAHVSAPIDRDSAEQAPITLLNGQKMTIEHLEGPDSYSLTVDGIVVPVSSIHQAENGIVFVVDVVLV